MLVGGQQVEQGSLLNVGQDAAVALVQVQLVDAQNAGRLEAVPAPKELGTGVEDVAYRLLVQAGLCRHEGVGGLEGFLLRVFMQPQRHAEAVHHLR